MHQHLALIKEFNAVENVALETGYTRPGFIDWKAQAEVTRRLLEEYAQQLLVADDGTRLHVEKCADAPEGAHHDAAGEGLLRAQQRLHVVAYDYGIKRNILRLLSLTIRLWANLLAGHMLIGFMSGGLAVLLGVKFLAWFLLPFGVVMFLFEAVLIAGLQAFIFAILAAIYLGSAVSEH